MTAIPQTAESYRVILEAVENNHPVLLREIYDEGDEYLLVDAYEENGITVLEIALKEKVCHNCLEDPDDAEMMGMEPGLDY